MCSWERPHLQSHLPGPPHHQTLLLSLWDRLQAKLPGSFSRSPKGIGGQGMLPKHASIRQGCQGADLVDSAPFQGLCSMENGGVVWVFPAGTRSTSMGRKAHLQKRENQQTLSPYWKPETMIPAFSGAFSGAVQEAFSL